jgi:nicotinate-nucleotide pyrophosphorylase (carboxylating)
VSDAWSHPEILNLIDLALAEDIGGGDITTESCVTEDRMAAGRFFAREEVVVAGIELLPIVYRRFGDDTVWIDLKFESGERAKNGDPVADVHGKARTLLSCERVCLNFLQRLGGIATQAQKYVRAVSGTRARVLDTRKTTPGLRRLEKLAAAAGGVTNHRLGLYDAILIKNNHISASGGITAAIRNARRLGKLIEIEVRTPEEVDEALAAGATHMLLDNQTPDQAIDLIARIGGRASVELSGKITLDTVRMYAQTGADYISCGAITHTVKAADFNFRLELL